MSNQKINKRFYVLTALAGIAIYLSNSIFPSPAYITIQPYILAIYFILHSLFVYYRMKTLEIMPYLTVVWFYAILYGLILLVDILLKKPHQFWYLEVLIQLSLSGTSVLIGYGLAFIFDRLGGFSRR